MPGPLKAMEISINGIPLTSLHLEALIEVVVDTSVHMPGMFSLTFLDKPVTPGAPAFTWTDNPTAFPIGGLVKITSPGDPLNVPPILPGVLINGEITSIDPEFTQDGVLLVVRGYDKTHRLHRGRKTMTYMMMPDNLIWSQVCATAGVTPAITPTGGPKEYVLQNNQTDWEFLKTRAALYGYVMTVNDLGVLQIGPREMPADPVPNLLQFGNNLYSFRPRVTAAGQVTATQVQGYDMKTKMPILGTFTPVPPVNGGPGVKLDFAATKLFGATAKTTVTDKPPELMPDATQHAKAVASEISSRFVTAEGLCKGAPRVKAGGVVTIEGVGVKFSGPYTVTSATHSWRADGEYLTEFRITGSDPDTILDLVDSGDHGRSEGLLRGVVIGQVSNNMDPFNLGRVKVRFPWLGMTPPIESNWARVATPWAGALKSGAQFIPEVNDEVLVAFEHGDPNRPYVIGSLYSTMYAPPNPTSMVVRGGKVTKRVFRGSTGHMIEMDDTPGMTAITFMDKTMMNYIKFDTTKNSVDIKMLGEVSIECLNFKVKANALAALESKALAVKSTTLASLEGATLDLKGKAAATLSAGAAKVALAGPAVNINNGALEVT